MATSSVSSADSRLFRQHTKTGHLGTPLLQQLCQEWAELHLSPDTDATIRRWHQSQPALAGLDFPGAITDHIDGADQATKDTAMLALLEILHGGDQLAGRILLQAMLPGLTHLARRTRTPRGTHSDETLQRTLTEFWFVITAAKSLPPRRVAGRLQLDTLHRLTSHRREADVWENHTNAIADVFDNEDPAECDERGTASPLSIEDSPVSGGGAFNADSGLLELLLHARNMGVITPRDAQFLAEVYVLSDSMADAARRLDKGPAAVRQRCSRLRQRLVTAVIEDRQAATAARLIA